MADGTESPVSDGASADSPEDANAHLLNADTDRVARIVAALRTAHAEQAASSGAGSTTQAAEVPDAPAPRRETSGVRSPAPKMPTLRWNPGARYRASRLADRPALPASSAPVPGATAAGPAGHPPVPPPPVPAPPVAGPPPLAGRLYRGPARRTGVFDREIWYPAARSSRVPRDVSDALVRAVERYRMGSISTSGLVRAIGRAHAA
ncbi:hypothetical protein ACFT2C_16430 [Promicromonospora sp. NPDC057138]|uniref:hypothetical protein n=1 Tax=Promicromonospora sp. NPDC057138 TaxID=3346031 RepID=UPI003640D4A4